MSRCYAYIVAYISRLEIGNVVLRPARLEVGRLDTMTRVHSSIGVPYMHIASMYVQLECNEKVIAVPDMGP